MDAPTPGPWDYVPGTEHHGPYVTSEFGSTICDFYDTAVNAFDGERRPIKAGSVLGRNGRTECPAGSNGARAFCLCRSPSNGMASDGRRETHAGAAEN